MTLRVEGRRGSSPSSRSLIELVGVIVLTLLVLSRFASRWDGIKVQPSAVPACAI